MTSKAKHLNNPPTRTLRVPVTDRTVRIVVPYYVTRDPELKKPKRVSVVTVSDPNPEQKPKRVSVVTVSDPNPEQKPKRVSVVTVSNPEPEQK
jgi:hypothetical protein